MSTDRPKLKQPKFARNGEDEIRQTTIYDAVARRIAPNQGFIHPDPTKNIKGDNLKKYFNHTLPPDEALFLTSRKLQPHVKAEDPDGSGQALPPDLDDEEQLEELYSWTRDLPEQLDIPDGELLEAIHAHSSDFYSVHPGANQMFCAMDGTALVALGILLEELAADTLGPEGDLAFAESQAEDVGMYPKRWNGRRMVSRHLKNIRSIANGGKRKRPSKRSSSMVKKQKTS